MTAGCCWKVTPVITAQHCDVSAVVAAYGTLTLDTLHLPEG
jgi:hypothetical protein